MNIVRIISIFLLFPIVSFGQDDCFPEKDENRLVYDQVTLLSETERENLENTLQEFARTTSNQVVLVVVNDVCGMDIAQYGTELIEKWGIGQSREDNGIAITLIPKTATQQGLINISVGRGLEGALPDAQLWLIEQNEMLPSFKQNDYYTGLSNGLQVIMDIAAKEYTIDDYAKRTKQKQRSSWLPFAVVFFIMIIFFITKNRQVKRYARVNGLDWFTAWMLLQNAGRSHRGSWGGFTGGGGWSGGGGGFGGFGGGSSGGGGASSSW